MYIRESPLHSEASTCRKRKEEREENERAGVGIEVGGWGVLQPLGAALNSGVVASPTAMLLQNREGHRKATLRLPGTNLGVVLCELSEGFEGLWISYRHRSIREAVGPVGGWYRWSEWPSVEGPQGLATEREVFWYLVLFA